MVQIDKAAKRIWRFLVYDDSWASFAADAIIILLVGKFILFPGMGLMLGTDFPVVAVVSSSMDHNDMDFDTWWASHGERYDGFNITKEQFESFYLSNGFKKGDVILIRGEDDLRIGDIIVYSVPNRADPIIHRITETNHQSVSTKGDANPGQIGFERSIQPEQIHGKAVFLLPYLGWVKVGFLELFGLL